MSTELTSKDLAREFTELSKRIDRAKPQQEDIDKWNEYLKQTPDLWRVTGDLSDRALRRMIKQCAGDSRDVEMSMTHGVETIKHKLGYRQANQLVQLLIEHVVVCWLHLSRAQLIYVDGRSHSITYDEADYLERFLSASQRRFLRACDTLVRVQRQGLKMQVNIAQQQVVDNRGTT